MIHGVTSLLIPFTSISTTFSIGTLNLIGNFHSFSTRSRLDIPFSIRLSHAQLREMMESRPK